MQGTTTSQKQKKEEIDDLLSRAKKQIDTYIKSLPKLKTLFQLEINQFKVGNVKNKLPNWQKITKTKELLEKIKGAKNRRSTMPRKVYGHKSPFTQAETKALDAGISKLVKKNE